jgi:hypothetical protein
MDGPEGGRGHTLHAECSWSGEFSLKLWYQQSVLLIKNFTFCPVRSSPMLLSLSTSTILQLPLQQRIRTKDRTTAMPPRHGMSHRRERPVHP